MSSAGSVVSQILKHEQRNSTGSKNMLTDVSQCRKRNNNTATAMFVHTIPTVDHQVEREGSESRDGFSREPRADWQCHWNV